MKSGKKRIGVRWHRSDDSREVRTVVEQKVRHWFEKSNIDWIDVVPTARKPGNKIETKKF